MQQSFAEIWNDAPVLNALRAPKLEGRCGACEFQKLCGGCRARPLAMDGNMMGEDTLCTYEPKGGAIITPFVPAEAAMRWTDDAETHIARVPGFVRRMVRNRAEEHVRSEGRFEVTKDDLTLLAKRRFGDAGPPEFVKRMRDRNGA